MLVIQTVLGSPLTKDKGRHDAGSDVAKTNLLKMIPAFLLDHMKPVDTDTDFTSSMPSIPPHEAVFMMRHAMAIPCFVAKHMQPEETLEYENEVMKEIRDLLEPEVTVVKEMRYWMEDLEDVCQEYSMWMENMERPLIGSGSEDRSRRYTSAYDGQTRAYDGRTRAYDGTTRTYDGTTRAHDGKARAVETFPQKRV
jgi:hypothetical protein